MVWQPTAIWCQRLAEGLLGVILSKFVLAASFALAIEALGQADSGQGDGGGFTTMIAGGAAFLIAARTPWVLFRLIPMTHTASSQSVNRQQVSGAISSMPGRDDGEDGDPDTHVWPLCTLGRRLRPSRDGAATGIRRSPHGCWRWTRRSQ